MEIRRGDIHYIDIPNAIGHEMMKDRPGIIISCDALNLTRPVVTVVLLTGSEQPKYPHNVEIKSIISARHGKSTARCDHIYTVDKTRVGKRMGCCTGTELAAVDDAILLTLGLGDGKYQGPMKRPKGAPCKAQEEPKSAELTADKEQAARAMLDLVRVQAERDTYKSLYEQLLGSLTMERRATA